MPPCISPIRIRRIPSWCTCPGSGIDDPNPSAIPMTMCSAGRWRATRSPAPRPFCMAMTMLSGSRSGAMAAATVSTSDAFVAITQRSQVPASRGTRPTWRLSTTKLPLAPDTVRPEEAMASMCSCQMSMAHTSCPALPRRLAYTEPMAPVPTIAIFMSSLCGARPGSNGRTTILGPDLARHATCRARGVGRHGARRPGAASGVSAGGPTNMSRHPSSPTISMSSRRRRSHAARAQAEADRAAPSRRVEAPSPPRSPRSRSRATWPAMPRCPRRRR